MVKGARTAISAVTIVAMLGVATAAAWASEGAPEGDPVSHLTWLTGCWERRTGTRLVEEQWLTPRGGMMLGMSRTVDGERTLEFEQMMIRSDGERLVFTAKPSGQPEASFASIELTPTKVVFENSAHDFPQRVIYALTADGALAARIEGSRDGRVVGVDFPYLRTDCPR